MHSQHPEVDGDAYSVRISLPFLSIRGGQQEQGHSGQSDHGSFHHLRYLRAGGTPVGKHFTLQFIADSHDVACVSMHHAHRSDVDITWAG